METQPRRIGGDMTRGNMKMRRFIGAVGVLAVLTLPLVGPSPANSTTVPTCFGHPATIVGTPGDDGLLGQSGVSDVIVGLGGNDVISGGAFHGEDDIPGAAPD